MINLNLSLTKKIPVSKAFRWSWGWFGYCWTPLEWQCLGGGKWRVLRKWEWGYWDGDLESPASNSGWSTAKPSWDPNEGGLQALEASGTMSFLPCWQLWLHGGAACTNLPEQNSTASELLPMKLNSGFPKAISLFHQPHQGRV